MLKLVLTAALVLSPAVVIAQSNQPGNSMGTDAGAQPKGSMGSPTPGGSSGPGSDMSGMSSSSGMTKHHAMKHSSKHTMKTHNTTGTSSPQ